MIVVQNDSNGLFRAQTRRGDGFLHWNHKFYPRIIHTRIYNVPELKVEESYSILSENRHLDEGSTCGRMMGRK